MNKILGSVNLFVTLIGFYVIGRLIYMHTLYYNTIGIFIIFLILVILIILLGNILNLWGYFTNFKNTDYKNSIVLILGLVLFGGMIYSWNGEIEESEYSKIKPWYNEVKENAKIEKLFKIKFDEVNKDNIISRSELFELKRINKYFYYLNNSTFAHKT